MKGLSAVCVVLTLALTTSALALSPKEGDFIVRDFRFGDGSSLPSIDLHYTTLGAPARDAGGRISNAVLFLHGTNGKGGIYLVPSFADKLFGPGQTLDTSRYFIIIPDQFASGAGKSTKPSDGLRARFPRYDYADMIRLTQKLLTEGLKVEHLRLLVGTSMGCMQGFQWAETDPGYLDALMLLSCQPVEIAGRNRMYRKMVIDSIRKDPGWKDGNYTEQPPGLRAALGHLLFVGSTPYWQQQYPNAAHADKFVDDFIAEGMKTTDANDLLFQYEASRNYNPAPDLGKITAHLALVNVFDDFLNPGDSDVAQQAMKQVKNGRYVVLPATEKTRGHFSYMIVPLWDAELQRLLEMSRR